MQVLCHSTRAFIQNAGGLKGFLIAEPVERVLKEAKDSGKIDNFLKDKAIDLEKVI